MSAESERRPRSPFKRSGLARLSDLESLEYAAIFAALESCQASFLARGHEFHVEGYAGHRDPLHCWSRAWEYPYAFWNLQSLRNESRDRGRNLRAVDVGSGSTFFPFAVAGLGYDVVCVDVDRASLTEVGRAAALIDCRPGTISTRRTNGSALPLASSDMDVAYCISVLEHIEQFDETVRELARVLAPGGLCILTVDLAIRGPLEMSPGNFDRLSSVLSELFASEYADATVHPADVLTSDNGPYPIEVYGGWRRGWYWAKQVVLKPLLGRQPTPATQLTVYGAVLRKR